jgi:hypothetical protein
VVSVVTAALVEAAALLMAVTAALVAKAVMAA